MGVRRWSAARDAFLVGAAALIAACSHSVEVRDPFPDPVIEALPLRVAVRYSPEFADYAFSESEPGEGNWTLRLGASHVRVFEKVFARLFASTTRVAQVKPEAGTSDRPEPAYDAVIEPVVTNVEFSLPGQSHTNQYAVWLRYKLNVYGRSGDLLEEWPVAA